MACPYCTEESQPTGVEQSIRRGPENHHSTEAPHSPNPPQHRAPFLCLSAVSASFWFMGACKAHQKGATKALWSARNLGAHRSYNVGTQCILTQRPGPLVQDPS